MTTNHPEDSMALRVLRSVLAVWVVALVLALIPYTGDPAGPIKNMITAWAVVLSLVLLVIAAVWTRRPVCLRSPLSLLLGLFILVYLMAALLSPHPAFSLNAVCLWMVLALLAWIVSQAYTRPDQVWFLLAVTVAAVAASSVYGFCQAAGYDPFPWSQTKVEEYRGLPSTYANPNFAGHALLLALIMATGLLARGVHRLRRDPVRFRGPQGVLLALTLGALILIAAHFYLTQIRGGRLALMGAAMVLGIFFLARRRVQNPLRLAVELYGFLGAAALCAVVTALIILPSYHRDEPLPIDSSLTLRLNGYYGAAHMIAHRPLLGYGPGNYELENIPYWTTFEKHWFALERKKNNHVHCDPLEAAIDAGLIGAALYFSLLFWGLFRGLMLTNHADPEKRRLGYVIAGAFTAFLIDGLFGFNMRVPVSASLIFMLLGVSESMAGGQETGRRDRWATPALALLLAIGIFLAVMQTRGYYAEFMLQRGKGGRYWANEFHKTGETEREGRALRDAYACVERGRILMPWDPRFPELQGQIDLSLRRMDEAAERLGRALALHPYHPDLMVSLAQAHLNSALRCFESAPGAPAGSSPALEAHLATAEKYAEQAQKLCAFYPEAYEALGRALFIRAVAAANTSQNTPELWKQAAEQLALSLRYGAPDRATLQRMLGQARINAGDLDGAQQALQAAVEAAPDQEETWQLFWRLAKDHGRNKPFVDALSRALGRLKQRSPVPTRAVGIVSMYLANQYAADPQNRPLARTAIQGALAIDPAQLTLWGGFASLSAPETRLADLQNALRELSVAPGTPIPAVLTMLRDLDPQNPEQVSALCKTLGEAAGTSARTDPPDTLLRSYGWMARLLMDPVDQCAIAPTAQGAALSALGSVLAAAAQWEDADRLLNRAVSLLPAAEQGLPLMHRSEAMAALKRKDEALALAHAAVRQTPNNITIRWNLARRLSDAQRFAEANFEYTALLQQINPQSPAYAKLQAEYRAIEKQLGAPQGVKHP